MLAILMISSSYILAVHVVRTPVGHYLHSTNHHVFEFLDAGVGIVSADSIHNHRVYHWPGAAALGASGEALIMTLMVGNDLVL